MARPRNLSTDDLGLFRCRALARTGLAIAITVAIALACMPNGVLAIDFAMLFANGIAVAIYSVLLRAAGPARGRLAHCIVLAALGLTHWLWLMASPLAALAGANIPAQNASMFVWTGLVFGAALFAGLFTWQSLAVMIFATALAGAAMYWEGFRRPGLGPPHAIGFPALFLHLGIALTLFDAARRWQASQAVGICRSCGYSLAGLRGERCPECGEVMRSAAETGAK